MTEPTDAELLALIEKYLGFKPCRDDMVIDPRTWRFHDVQRYRDLKADILAEWGTPAVAKWAPEEIADGERGIRWVTNEGIHGRPTDHDVRKYLKQTPTARGCHCDECKQFYTTPQPTQEQAVAVPLTDAQIAEMMRDTWGCASIAPRHALEFARAVERAALAAQGGK